jgi:hypothetical protein
MRNRDAEIGFSAVRATSLTLTRDVAQIVQMPKTRRNEDQGVVTVAQQSPDLQ